jgi:pimeloyl-ACP methyl ester carboxylesterase
MKADRPLLIYVPGMDGTGKLLRLQTKTLAAYCDVFCLSIPPDRLDNWEQLTKTALREIETALEGKSRRYVYLCGESFGGCLALKIALAAPWLFQRLILVNPASCFNQRPILGLGIGITRLLPDWLHGYSALSLLPFLADLSRIAPLDRQSLLASMKSLPPQVVSWRLFLLQNFQVSSAEFSRLTLPTLIIASAADRLLPSITEAQRLVKEIPNSKMVILPNSGHACLLETDVNLYHILDRQNFLELPIKQRDRGFKVI